MAQKHVSTTTIDEALWNIQKYLMDRYGCSESEREIDALRYYVNTGRASGEFLRALVNAKPFMIGRLLHKGGTVDETIKRVRAYLAA